MKEFAISRKEFLQRVAALGTISIITPFAVGAEGFKGIEGKIKIGVIGCGSVSTQYLPHLSKSDYVQLVSTCDIIPQRALSAAEQYKIPNHYPSIEKMLAGAPFDLLVNLTDMQEHGRLNKIALQAGKHVWSEKPMATTYHEGKELLDLAKKNGLRIWGAPAVVNSPPAYNWGATPSSKTARANTWSFMPVPTGDQLTPFHRAMRFAPPPPAVVNNPPAYKAGPSPSSKTARANTEESSPEPNADQLAPSHLAMWFAPAPPALVKNPAA